MINSPFGITASSIAKWSLLVSLCGALAAAPTTPAADTLYMPRTVKEAIANGTRSLDGKPGPKYWQNHGRYTMTMKVMPPDRTVRGSERITYMNNSPDTLNALVIKLFLNIHKPGAPRNGGASADYLTPGVQIDSFAVNGEAVPWQDSDRYFTWQPVRLPTPLMPHDSVQLAFDWHYQISLESGREGMIDSTTYYLAYFYPRVAVYDDYNGWDTMNFTDEQEFYSDFNDYDVTIQAPANYTVWGTGTLVNAKEVLQPEPLARYEASFKSDTTIHVATKEDWQAKRVTVQQPVNSWHFTAKDVPDVAFNVSDHYDWDAASVIVDSSTRRRASVQAAFNDTAADYHHMVQFGRHALGWLSHNWPGVPYPYEKSTVVQGFADMEYPMMVNDASTPDTVFSRFVVEHEMAHTWFPFYMGINETRYAFMDEGWATTFEYLIGQNDLGKERATSFYKQFRVAGWIRNPSPLMEVPIITPEDALVGAAYGPNAYGKASLGYLALKDLLGDAMFRKVLHGFVERWHGKHPLPWDFFNTVNDISGKNLNWFWRSWYFDNSYIDLAVAGVTKSGNGYTVALDNIGGMLPPVDLTVKYTDGSSQTLHQTPAIWEANQKRATVRIPTRKQIASVSLDDGSVFMDADTTNDTK
ncbi:MAG TPA: M1 family metallopeptidase [Gemmatimonadaceae bacterium]|nr:M1 family metallopeptidase [Gemmatimonadaceae bacterium]